MAYNEAPILSKAERDRRFLLTRDFMHKHDLDVLILGAAGGRIFQYFSASQQYLSNEPNGSNPTVIFPRDSEPVLLTIRTQWGQIWAEQQEGVQPWIEDYRLNEGETNVVSVLKEKGVVSGRAGLVLPGSGGGSFFPGESGSLADPMWRWIKHNLSDLEGVDVALPYGLATLVKSEEERQLIRYCGQISDKAGIAYIEAAKLGATEIDLYAAAMHEFHSAGVDCENIIIVLGNFMAGMGQPRWLLPNRPARKLRRGDVVVNELFPVYGGIETQVSFAVHIGEPSNDAVKAYQTCLAAHAAAMKTMRPGVSFHSVWQAMFDAVSAAGCWNWTPLIHSLSPMCLVGTQHHNLEMRKDLPLKLRLPAWPPKIPPSHNTLLEEGMIFSVEPGAATGGVRSRTGCLVMVNAEGAEELTQIGTQMHIKH